ncbi:Translin-associated protein X [Blattella germanica]|nr:Translin-associated protein X [Blattella germanica]
MYITLLVGHGRRGRADRKNNGKQKHILGERGREVLENIDVNSPVIKCFQQYAKELDCKHDRYERLVKIKSKRETVLAEATTRLKQLADTHFKSIAKELKGEDPYQYDWKNIQKELIYEVKNPKTEENSSEKTPDDVEANASEELSLIQTRVSPMDYILGVADLTGELMRKCINSLGSGNIEGCFQTCNFVRDIYSGFLSVSCTGYKEISRKIITLRQSLSKMENACYTIHVRGSEIPKHMLADVISGSQDDYLEEDEGFY